MKSRFILILIVLAVLASLTLAQDDLPPLDSDFEPDRLEWYELEDTFGPMPDLPDGLRVGAVNKTRGEVNAFWGLLAEGYANGADMFGVTADTRAAVNEDDRLGQLTITESMLVEGFDIILVSPQTDTNLIPAVEMAATLGVPVVNVNDAVIPTATHYAGPNQYENGVRAARWFIEQIPDGGKVAVIEGQSGVYAAFQRTDGFIATILDESEAFDVVASVPGDWDPQKAYDEAAAILAEYPDLVGFYCNNDTMALGVVDAVKDAGLLDQVSIIGTDGIGPAYESILAGELDGTVDSFPVLMGEVAMEVAVRLLSNQDLPRVVATPQALVTLENYERYKGEDADPRAALLEDLAE